MRSDWGGATQIYHLNLLKTWKEAEPVSLVMLVSERDELGPNFPFKLEILFYSDTVKMRSCKKICMQRH